MQTEFTEMRAGLAALQDDLTTKEAEASAAWEAFESARSATVHGNLPAAEAEKLHATYAAKTAELAQMRSARDAILGALSAPGVKDGRAALVSLGEKAVAGHGYRELMASGALRSESQPFNAKLAESSAAEFKALITSGAQGTFLAPEHRGIVTAPQRPPSVLDLVNVGTTASDTIEFARQTAFSNVAAETAEATTVTTGTKPEATLAFEKVTAQVQTIAHWVPATRRSLADGGQLQQVIDNVLQYGLRLRLEDQIVSGDGAGANLRGILNTSGILSQPKGADSVADAVHKGITQLRLGGVEPTGALINPTDWELLRLTRDDSGATAGTGAYLYGPPAVGVRPTIWGIPAVVTSACPDDTIIVGDFAQTALWIREGATVLASDSHSDYFVRNLVALLAEVRAAFAVLQPSALCKITSVD